MNGILLRDAVISAANNIANQVKLVDALNVFPVPDGDTGTNMSMTIGAAKRELEKAGENITVPEAASITAAALLRGARGNSGVILSLLFRGFSKGLAGKNSPTPQEMCAALGLGVEAAYKAVMKPTEGTILTVARLAAEKGEVFLDENPETDLWSLWEVIIRAAADALEQTPELLPVLKKAGVVDAGGKGLLIIFEGMGQVFAGNGIVPLKEEVIRQSRSQLEDEFVNAAGAYDEVINFTYCTEFLVNKQEDTPDSMKLRGYLESIGDCVVVVEDEEIIKCHVHTDNPGKALQEALKFGSLTNMKIENMREQHAAQQKKVQDAARTQDVPADEFPYAPVNPEMEYGFVAVAAGDGGQKLFYDLGVQKIVSGGQTMNPSTDDILRAIQSVPAKTVFVLPNNKNIIMAAEQTIRLADRTVRVLQSRTIPQGLSAMLAFEPEAGRDDNILAMNKAMERVGSGQITFAARDSEYDGYKIKRGDLLGMENGRLTFTERDLTKACIRLVKNLIKANKESSFITLIYGEEISAEQAKKVESALRARLPSSIELVLIEGNQPVYYFLVSVE